MLQKKAFCEECRKDVNYVEKDEIKKGTLKEKEYQYLGKSAFCEECNSKLYIPYIEDYNLKSLYDEFRKYV